MLLRLMDVKKNYILFIGNQLNFIALNNREYNPKAVCKCDYCRQLKS